MTLQSFALEALTLACLTTSAFAQTTFPEVEPNNQKAEATVVTDITAGDAITGFSTGTGTVAGDTSSTTSDYFRVKTSALPLGIYRHRLTLTTFSTSKPNGTIRGLNQSGTSGTSSTGGTPGTQDVTVQVSDSSTVPSNMVQWYGFGKQEEIYYRVSGTTQTTASYTVTLATAAAPVTTIATPFEAGPITISTIGLTTVNTIVHVYDSNLSAIPGFVNDDEGPDGPTLQSRLTRTYAPGTYYLSVSTSGTPWNLPAPPDEDAILAVSLLMDFPDVIVRTSLSSVAQDLDFTMTACNGVLSVTNQLPSNSQYTMAWFQFSVMAGAPGIQIPANDACSNAQSLGASGGTFNATVSGATNDGSAACDPGGATSRDVWYSYTNSNTSPRLLAVDTCGASGIDALLSIHSSCADAVGIACNDDCGGTPCSATAACTSTIVAPGQTVLVRVSDKGLGGCGQFTLHASANIPPPPNDSCSTPIPVNGPGTYAFDNVSATTGPEGQAEPLCFNASQASIYNDVWFVYVPVRSTTVTVSTCGLIATSATQDSKIAVYAGSGCPVNGSAIACNDDNTCSGFSGLNATVSFAATCGSTYLIQIGTFGASAQISGSFSVSEGAGTPCAPVSFCSGDAVGTTCVACANNGVPGRGCGNASIASGALLAAGGVASLTNDTLVLTGSDLTGPCLFFQANGLAPAPVAFGDGMLCAAIGITRLGVIFPAAGVGTLPDVTLPSSVHLTGAPINAGDTKHYQCWYRDAAPFCSTATYNTTNGVSLLWIP